MTFSDKSDHYERPVRALTNHIWPISPNIWPKSDYFSKQYLTKIWPKRGLFDHPDVNFIVLFFMRSFTGSFNNITWLPWLNWLSTGREIIIWTSTSNTCLAARLRLLYIIRYWKENFSAECLTNIWPKKGLWSFKWPLPTNRTIVSALNNIYLRLS